MHGAFTKLIICILCCTFWYQLFFVGSDKRFLHKKLASEVQTSTEKTPNINSFFAYVLPEKKSPWNELRVELC